VWPAANARKARDGPTRVFLLGPTYANFSEEAPVRLMRCFRQLAVDRYRPSATRDDPARK